MASYCRATRSWYRRDASRLGRRELLMGRMPCLLPGRLGRGQAQLAQVHQGVFELTVGLQRDLLRAGVELDVPDLLDAIHVPSPGAFDLPLELVGPGFQHERVARV